MSLRRFWLIAAALVLTLPTAALADGVSFGFGGGALDASGSTLTTMSLGGAASTLDFVGYIPGGNPSWSGPNLGTVDLATGNFLGNCSTGATCYAAAGSVVQIIATSAFAPGISAGTVLFSGSFIDITTGITTGFASVPPGPYAPGTGAVFANIPCTGPVPAGTTCFRLFGTISGTIDPALLAALGLSGGPSASGWIAQIDLLFTNNPGLVLNIRGGDAQLVVPEPASLALFGTGLLNITNLVRHRMKA
jgi:hypothetical protein